MKYGLTETTVENICAVFARFPEIEKAILYGSRAKGNFKTGSDIDLTLCGEALTSDLCSTISSALDDLLLPYTIDLSVFDELNHAELREHIERVGVLFYEQANHGIVMKKGWKTDALGNLCDILDSQRKPITKRDRTPGEYPYYGATGILDFVEGYLFDEPLVLVGEDGAKWGSGENTAFAVQGKCWVNNHAHVLRPHRSVLTDNWLIYFLVHSDLSEFVSGLTVPKLNQGSLREIPIPVPPLPEQQRIVGILDEAFDGIATAKANAEKNLQNARALFESHLQAVFTQRGDGWVETTLGVAYDVRDGTHDSPKYHATGYPLITSKNLKREGLSFDDVKLISEQDYQKINERSAVHKGDVLFAMIGTIGNPTLVEVEPNFAIKNVALFKMRQGQSGTFLMYYLGSSTVITKMMNEAKGTTQKFVGLGYLRGFPINLPPLAEQIAVVEKLAELEEETLRLESIYQQKVAALEAFKKSLLHQAFTGNL
jgi:type I restriction enzyme S subunit